MLLHEALLEHQHPLGNKIAVKADEGSLSYHHFYLRAYNLATELTRHINKGDRVVLFMDNSLNLCVSIFGVLMAGGVFVVINPTTKEDKLAYILNDCSARILISQNRFYPMFDSLMTRTKSLVSIFVDASNGKSGKVQNVSDIFLQPPEPHTFPRIIDQDLAALIYTSGSTGEPKGVTMNHLNMASAARSIITYLNNVENDIVLNVLPMSFDYGLYQLLMVITFGGTLVLKKDFLYPAEVIETMQKERITGFPGVPTLFAMLFKMPSLESRSFPYLRYITNTGAALPETYIRNLMRFFPSAQIYSMYGLTECKRVSYVPPEELEIKIHSVGVAMPNSEVFIINDAGEMLPPGQIGELCVRGSSVMQGYWNRPAETTAAIVEGASPWQRYLRTGDLFKMDEDGYLYFISRKDDIIKSRGEKVSPKEIENILCKLSGIQEAAVIGVPDPFYGQAIAAYVRCDAKKQISKRDIIRHCSQHLENFSIPQYVCFVEKFPTTANGKIDKKQLCKKVSNKDKI